MRDLGGFVRFGARRVAVVDRAVALEDRLEPAIRRVPEVHALLLRQRDDRLEQRREHPGVAGGQRLVLRAGRELVVGLERYRGVPVDDVRGVAVAVGGVAEALRAEPVVHQVPVTDVLERIALLEDRRRGELRADRPVPVERVPFRPGLRPGGVRHRDLFDDVEPDVGLRRGAVPVDVVRRRHLRREIVEVHVLRAEVEQRVGRLVERHGVLVEPELRHDGGDDAMAAGLPAVGVGSVAIPLRVAHAAELDVRFRLVVLIVPRAHASARLARARVLLREVVLAPVEQLEDVALAELLGLERFVRNGAVQQPPSGIQPRRAGAENRVRLLGHVVRPQWVSVLNRSG